MSANPVDDSDSGEVSAPIQPDEVKPPATQELQLTGRLQKGHDPRRWTGGSRPRKLREIERLLNNEHRNVEKMREVFERLRALALGEVVVVPYFDANNLKVELHAELKADSRFMQLYLDRLLGPAKAFDEDMDLSDAPSEVIEYLRIKVSRK